jgi:hypothetical protein
MTTGICAVRGFFLDSLANLKTVHTRHHHVEQHDIGHCFGNDFKRCCAVICRQNLVILDKQFCFEQTNIRSNIVND